MQIDIEGHTMGEVTTLHPSFSIQNKDVLDMPSTLRVASKHANSACGLLDELSNKHFKNIQQYCVIQRHTK